jgi:protocatechuate 4,5-dioxygenase, alpha chain
VESVELTGGSPVLDAFEDVPGTYFFNGRRSRKGYALNMFCMSLLKEENRTAFRANEDLYLDQFKVTAEQRQAIRNRQWITMLELGGNIYYTFKLAACDGMTFQQLAALQTGVAEQEYLDMMIAGGRSIEGNRSRAEQIAASAQKNDVLQPKGAVQTGEVSRASELPFTSEVAQAPAVEQAPKVEEKTKTVQVNCG